MTTDFVPRAARQLPPYERDLRIFQLAEIYGWTHDDIAREVDLTRRRVSQIVADVRRWLAQHPADAPELKTDDERRQYERNLERMRLQDIMLRAVQGLDRAPAALTTTRTSDDGSQTRTTRDQPPVDVRLLRMYLRAVTALGKLDREPLPPAPPPPPLAEQPWMHQKIQEVVARWQLRSHSYILSDSCFEKFAAELTTAFLTCVEDVLEARREAAATAAGEGDVALTAPAAETDASISQISLPETAAADVVAPTSDPATADVGTTSIVQFERKPHHAGRETAGEKNQMGNEPGNEPGSAPQYPKPLFIGPLPDNHPVRQPIRPLAIRRVDPTPVSQVRITPQQLGAEVSESSESTKPNEPARTQGPQSPTRIASEGVLDGG